MLPTVAGTPQAQEAVIENSIPQTATVPLKNGPKYTPQFDGPPQFVPVAGTPLTYVTNSHVPVIQVSPNAFYSVTAGVWFTAPQLTGPWVVATSVPPVIYTIPPSSPIYYVTYVRIYEATPQVVYVGYTPGYLGTVVAPWGTVVYGTGYAYTPWVGTYWYAPPYTYGIAAAPIYNPYVGYSWGFAMGLATAAWMEPWWGGAYYYPGYWGGYGCCATASANVYGHWGATTYSGTRSWYAGGGVAGTTASGNYYNSRTGTSGSYNAGKQYNAWTGNATRGYDRTMNGAAGGSGQVARATNYNTYTGQRSTANAASGTGAGRKLLQPRRRDDRRTRGQRACRRWLDVQRQDRPDEHVGHRQRRQQSLRRRQRQRLQEHRRRLAAAFVERMEQCLRRFVVGRQGIAGALERRRQIRRLQRGEPDVADEQRGRRLRRRRFRGGGGFGGGDRFGGGGGWGGGGGGFGGRFGGGGGFGGGGFRGGGRR